MVTSTHLISTLMGDTKEDQPSDNNLPWLVGFYNL